MRVLYVNIICKHGCDATSKISFLQDVVHTRALIGRVASLHETRMRVLYVNLVVL